MDEGKQYLDGEWPQLTETDKTALEGRENKTKKQKDESRSYNVEALHSNQDRPNNTQEVNIMELVTQQVRRREKKRS